MKIGRLKNNDVFGFIPLLDVLVFETSLIYHTPSLNFHRSASPSPCHPKGKGRKGAADFMVRGCAHPLAEQHNPKLQSQYIETNNLENL